MYEELELWKECGFQYKKKAKENVSKLKVNDNSFMLIDSSNKQVSNDDTKEFDEWFAKLGEKNGYTKY